MTVTERRGEGYLGVDTRGTVHGLEIGVHIAGGTFGVDNHERFWRGGHQCRIVRYEYFLYIIWSESYVSLYNDILVHQVLVHQV